jgi:hypothetical protein
MSKTLCPKCSDILPIDARACACGWRKDGPRGKDEVNLDCTFNDHGHICGLRGSMSDSTVGGGPWYCSRHYWMIKRPDERPRADAMRKIGDMTPVRSFHEPREREPGEDEEYNLATQA